MGTVSLYKSLSKVYKRIMRNLYILLLTMAVLTNILMASPLPCPGCEFVGTTKRTLSGTCKADYEIYKDNDKCCDRPKTNLKIERCCHEPGKLEPINCS